jgi:hypothetical protein
MMCIKPAICLGTVGFSRSDSTISWKCCIVEMNGKENVHGETTPEKLISVLYALT